MSDLIARAGWRKLSIRTDLITEFLRVGCSRPEHPVMADTTSSKFDPYHRWLAIPKDQRPPTLYQLLGLNAGETDLEVIEEAARRQINYLRSYRTGPQAAICVRVSKEI